MAYGHGIIKRLKDHADILTVSVNQFDGVDNKTIFGFTDLPSDYCFIFEEKRKRTNKSLEIATKNLVTDIVCHIMCFN